YERKVIQDQAEKIRELNHSRVRNVPKDKFLITSIGSAITIEMPEESFVLEDIQFAKKGLAREISKYFPEATSVQFIETYVLKAPKAEAAAEPAKESAAAPTGAAEEPKAIEGETKKE
ncbi:MAG: hypothetical protein ABC527_06190, partial [Candidatus Methanosuratincola petrocarbonis]